MEKIYGGAFYLKTGVMIFPKNLYICHFKENLWAPAFLKSFKFFFSETLIPTNFFCCGVRKDGGKLRLVLPNDTFRMCNIKF